MLCFLGGLLVGFILGGLNWHEDNEPTTQDIIVGWKK